MLEMTRYGFSIVDKGFDCLWDAEFVSILPIYFADGVSEATRLVNKKGIRIRVITEIKKDNLESVIQLSKLYDVRHLQGIKGNFGILDRKQYIVVMFSSYDKPPEQGLFSNSKTFVEQQQYVFDTLWERAVPANVKIRQIEMAYEPEFMKSFSNKEELNRVLIELIDCSIKAILILLPRPQSFNRITEKNIFRALRSAMLRNVEIRIIMASKIAHGTIHQRRIEKLNKNISIRYLHREIPNSQLSLIIDYKFTLSIEENDKDKPSSREKEIQLTHYSNIDSKAMVSSSIFENYWMKAH